MARPRTVLVLADQLGRHVGPLSRLDPSTDAVVLIESAAMVTGRPWHVQRLHALLSGMRHLALDLEADGIEVRHLRSADMAAGIAGAAAWRPEAELVAMAPSTPAGRRLLGDLGVTLEEDERFLTTPEDFVERFGEQRRMTMETFYRWQRARGGWLMEGDQPAGGTWNLDAENRKGLPRGGTFGPEPLRHALDAIDIEVLAGLPDGLPGAPPDGLWPVTRAQALTQLDHVIAEVLPCFGPHEDAMSSEDWSLAHTLLAAPLNMGLLHPREVADRIDAAWRAGGVPLSSAEGLLRQVIGWREYVWCLYWAQPGWRDRNGLGATRPLPPAFTTGETDMACLAAALRTVDEHAWTHHIPRLIVMGALGLMAGVEPQAMVGWMRERFVDAADWVMQPNVVGMALYADGGIMATKPYAAGGAYISKMSDHCRGCRYDPKARTGEDACPYTTLYWDFLDRHKDALAGNHRMARQLAAARQRPDLVEIRARAAEVLDALDEGRL